MSGDRDPAAVPIGTAFYATLDAAGRDLVLRRTADGSLAGATSLPGSAAADLRRLADEIDRRTGRLSL